MTQLSRVRLSWQDERVILSVPVQIRDLNVSQFLAYLTEVFQNQKKLQKDNKFVSASVGGFKLFNNDLVQYALMNDDTIELTDYNTWITNIFNKEKYTEWVNLSEYDLEDKCRKWISVGTFQKYNQLSISLGSNSTTKKLDLFELDELQNFSKDGRVLICQDGDTSSSSQIFFEVENNVVKEVILSLKTKSDFRPHIKSVKIKVEDRLDKVEISTVQRSLDIPEQFDDPIPSPVYKGEELKDPEYKIEHQLSNDQSVEAKGIVLKQNEDPFFYLNTHYKQQQISIEFLLMNNNTLKTSIIDIKGEYKKGEEWIPATVYSGYKESRYHYTLSYPHNHVITLESRQVSPLAISLIIPVEIKQTCLSNELRFLHKSFGEPLQLRYIITTQDGDKFTLHTQVQSKTYDLITAEKYAKNRNGLIKFIYCDDIELRERLHISFLHDKGGQLCLHLNNTLYTFSFATLNEHIYNAVKANKSVYKIEELSWTNNTYSVDIFALVNLEKKYMYAIKCVLQSSTNYTEEYVPVLPKHYK